MHLSPLIHGALQELSVQLQQLHFYMQRTALSQSECRVHE